MHRFVARGSRVMLKYEGCACKVNINTHTDTNTHVRVGLAASSAHIYIYKMYTFEYVPHKQTYKRTHFLPPNASSSPLTVKFLSKMAIVIVASTCGAFNGLCAALFVYHITFAFTVKWVVRSSAARNYFTFQHIFHKNTCMYFVLVCVKQLAKATLLFLQINQACGEMKK